MPITSPVLRISGPRITSTPGNLLNGKTTSFTLTCFGSGSSVDAQLGERFARHHFRRDLRPGDAGGFADERHRSRRAGIDFDDVNLVVLDRVLHVHQPADAQGLGQRLRLLFQLRDDLFRQRIRRQRAGAVAGVNAGFLDVLHDADDDRLPVAPLPSRAG